MRRLRPWLILTLALVTGGTAGLLALRYLRQYTPQLAADTRSGYIAVATRELSVGSVLEATDVRLMPWPGSAMPAGVIASTEGVVGRGLITTVQENEPLLETKLAPAGTGGGLPVLIPDGMRAVSVRVDEVVGVAGFIQPEARVDVHAHDGQARAASPPPKSSSRRSAPWPWARRCSAIATASRAWCR